MNKWIFRLGIFGALFSKYQVKVNKIDQKYMYQEENFQLVWLMYFWLIIFTLTLYLEENSNFESNRFYSFIINKTIY